VILSNIEVLKDRPSMRNMNATATPDIRITGSEIITMNDSGEVVSGGVIEIRDGIISRVGKKVPKEISDEKINTIDGSNHIALPGFINTHTHVAMTSLRGYADDLSLMPWLQEKIWPMELKMTPEDRYWASMLGVLDMIRSGTTCLVDMSRDSEQVAKACETIGVRALLSEGLLGTETDNPEIKLAESIDLAQKWNKNEDNLIHFWMGPHALYTCPQDYLKKIISIAEELSIGIHIHLSETEAEVLECKQNFSGKSPVEVLYDLGLFDHPTIAAHCVHLSKKDMGILADHNVTAVHNPSSNMKLGSGFMDLPQLLKQGINVTLGTDSAVSNNMLSILNEMRMAALIHKGITHDASVIPALEVLKMATRNGARAIGLESSLGQIKKGFFADIILIRKNQLHTTPDTNSISHLVYSHRTEDVQTVIIHGKIVLHKGKFVDQDMREVIAQTNQFISRISN
jgi:5-methylthioadenosine/S-adenosylhomocysteine deaminase